MPTSLSVALCTWNGETHLAQQLQSIGAQTRLPDELILCDDCSGDGTLTVARAFASAAPFPVTLVSNPDRLGIAANFERACRMCHGDWIALCDQDDVWCPEKLETLERIATAEPDTDLIFADAWLVDRDLVPLGHTLWDSLRFTPTLRQRLARGEALDVLLKRSVVTGATVVFRSTARAWCFPIPSGWLHDAWLALMIAVFGRLRAVETPLIHYRQHAGNQVGAGERDLRRRVRSASAHGREAYEGLAAAYGAALERVLTLEERGTIPRPPDAAGMIREKIRHLDLRGALPSSPVRRLGRVVGELARGGYGRYSDGVLSALRDLIATP